MTEIDAALSRLTPDEERVLRARFRLGNVADRPAMARRALGLSWRRRRIEAQAFRKLRALAVAGPLSEE